VPPTRVGLQIAIVGATGAVGAELLSILADRQFPVGGLDLIASSRGAGRVIHAFGREHHVQTLASFEFKDVDIAFFSAGTAVSQEYAPQAASAGALVIDNTNAFRMDKATPLVVPEVNAHVLGVRPSSGIIANPNCSTIQMVRVLEPLDRAFGLDQVYCSTYQAASGRGLTGLSELRTRSLQYLSGEPVSAPSNRFPAELPFNVIPQVDVFTSSGATLEEQKMRQETRKILGRDDIQVFPFAARVPVFNGHSEVLILRFRRKVDIDLACDSLAKATMIKYYSGQGYPHIHEVSGTDHVHVGRLHTDPEDPLVLYAWVAADNLRVGAALNAVEIAECVCARGLVQCRKQRAS
jgi:aspartate-semialdehyde dehydrogenase